MTRIAMLTTAAVIALASPAAAGWNNGINPNALNSNAVNPNALNSNGLNNNGLGSNGVGTNGVGPTAVIAHSPPSDFCTQGKGTDVIAHSPPSDFCAQGPTQPVGFSLGGVDGMKVMSVELPR